MRTALITGATAGIGRAFALELAARGMNLVLVARDEPRLLALAGELNFDFGVEVQVMSADLSNQTQIDEVACRAAAEDIDLVVNNAGFGLNQPFVGGDLKAEQQMLDVLVTAVMRITHSALPGMVERNRGGVINVSSVASWLASGTYSAAKSWVTTFSESLATQLRSSDVHVMALCPGFTRTEFHERANMETTTIPEWMWLEVDAVVKEALTDFAGQHAVSVPGVQYKSLGLVAQYLPRPLVRKISVMQARRR
jgi:short-subunit dehydrogenase